VGARFRRETDYSAAMATKIDELVKAERTVRKLHAELSTQGKKLLPELREKLVEALAEGDTDDATATLVRVSALLGELPGPEPVDLLIDVLGGESPEARAVAGEELENIAFERFKEVALGIERALGRLPSDSPALTELPYLLAEVAEPGCVKLLGRFLAHADPNVVASAIEALAELGDPAGAPLLAPIERDGRQVEMDDDADGMLVTLGELAHEARELLLDVDAKQTGKP
jgi:HEAT repeat protein